jgi:hypothetical protein
VVDAATTTIRTGDTVFVKLPIDAERGRDEKVLPAFSSFRNQVAFRKPSAVGRFRGQDGPEVGLPFKPVSLKRPSHLGEKRFALVSRPRRSDLVDA